MRIRQSILLTLVGIALCSCATYGNKTLDDPRKYLNLREGVSTKLDVYSVFGQPHDVDYANDKSRSMWTYFKVESSPNAWTYVPYIGMLAGGTNEDTTKAYFFFDGAGRYIRVQTNKSSESENEWAGMARLMSGGKAREARATRVADEMKKIGKPFDKKIAKSVAYVR
jgi:hypothetical protein